VHRQAVIQDAAGQALKPPRKHADTSPRGSSFAPRRG
jgi:hypothetical protein